MLDHCSNPGFPIPLPTIEVKVLDKIIQWLEYHVNDPFFTAGHGHMEELGTCGLYMDVWENCFFQMDRDMLFKVLAAANYLDIQGNSIKDQLLSDVCLSI